MILNSMVLRKDNNYNIHIILQNVVRFAPDTHSLSSSFIYDPGTFGDLKRRKLEAIGVAG